MSKIEKKYIRLSYYVHNKTFPDKSGSAGKFLYERKSHIARLTSYKNSTKIHTTYGDIYEVSEDIKTIWSLIDG